MLQVVLLLRFKDFINESEKNTTPYYIGQVHLLRLFLFNLKVRSLTPDLQNLCSEVEIKPFEAALSKSKNNGSKYQCGAVQTICSKEEA